MKVLWFSVTPALYGQSTSTYNGGGWIEALESILAKDTAVQLGIAFEYQQKVPTFRIEQDSVTYYPINIRRSIIGKIKDRYTYREKDALILQASIKIIQDFQPDLIHIWGSEWCFGLLYQHTDIPMVIHMQGCWPPYRNANYPPGYSYAERLLRSWWNPKRMLGIWLQEKLSRERAAREENILSHTTYFMGRTLWDYALTRLYAPASTYFYCSEALRPAITSLPARWQMKKRTKFVIVTVGGAQTLKGIDVILRAAFLLKKWKKFDFEWKLAGPTPADMNLYERMTRIRHADVNVIPLGKKDAAEVGSLLLDADIYVHAAYIDNSPNAVCEAQYLGVPIISTNVGGIRSLFPDDYPQDLLMAANDPYYLAAKLGDVLFDEELLKELSQKNWDISRKRHSEKEIMSNLLSAYSKVIGHK